MFFMRFFFLVCWISRDEANCRNIMNINLFATGHYSSKNPFFIVLIWISITFISTRVCFIVLSIGVEWFRNHETAFEASISAMKKFQPDEIVSRRIKTSLLLFKLKRNRVLTPKRIFFPHLEIIVNSPPININS